MADEAQLDAIARANAFAIYNGITTHQTGDGTAEAILEIGPDSLNPYGLLHGGAYYTLADCAAGSACRTDGRKYVTLHGSLDFIRSARAGQVIARARVEHRGRTTCLVSITVHSEAVAQLEVEESAPGPGGVFGHHEVADVDIPVEQVSLVERTLMASHLRIDVA